MTTVNDLSLLLNGTPFQEFLQIDPRGMQLPSWIATSFGLKPAMDLWVPPHALPAFETAARRAGLVYYLDCYFDRHSDALLTRFSNPYFTTTRAALARGSKDSDEAHIFVASSQAALREIVCAGWYPLLVEGELVEKHLGDHVLFGRALGYPSCCISFFLQRNNWQTDNHYYASYRSSSQVRSWLANTLPRHSAFYLAPHIACSFSCAASQAYSAKLYGVITGQAPIYGAELRESLLKPMLCLSELKIYTFQGNLRGNRVSYTRVDPINPTPHTDDLYCLLSDGDECIVDSNIVKVLRRGRLAATYFARADRYGPEFPFLVECR